MTIRSRILEYITKNDGCTQLQIAKGLFGEGGVQQQVNGEVRRLVNAGSLICTSVNGVYRYALSDGTLPVVQTLDAVTVATWDGLSEDAVKEFLCIWLHNNEYYVDCKMGREPGIDILAERPGERWIIEVKGCGSLPAMRVNYFLAVLGETLQRMNDDKAKYSIAFPNMQQFRRLWERLPALAKKRTGITALFVDEGGNVIEE